MGEVFDLFGEPVPKNWGGRGRPEHIPTQLNRNRVSMLTALGWSTERIAAALYVTAPTLRKHYFSELKFREVARDRLDATIATKLLDLFIKDGNVSAARELQKLVERNDLMNYPVRRAEHADKKLAKPETEKAEKLGKKEKAIAEAHNPDAGTPLGELMARRQGTVN